MHYEIVKIQVPVMTNEAPPLALVYNRDRSLNELIPINDEIRKMMNGELKKYFKAHLSEEDQWVYFEEVEPQPW